MFSKDDILARLHTGDSIETIAAEMTDLLNSANDAYLAAQKSSEKKAKKEKIARQFNDLVREYAMIECPEAVSVMDMEEEDIDAVIEAMDEMFKLLNFSMSMKSMFAEPQICDRKAKINSPKSDDEILANFISKICQ